MFGIEIDVFGFDTGAGLPPPKDYRDLPNLYRRAGFPMDQEKLRQRLKKARLIIGDVGEMIGGFIESGPAPVGFVSIDVDLYTSTMAAFKLFDAGTDVLDATRPLLPGRHSGRDIFRVHRRTAGCLGIQRRAQHAERSLRSSGCGISCAVTIRRKRGRTRCSSRTCSTTSSTERTKRLSRMRAAGPSSPLRRSPSKSNQIEPGRQPRRTETGPAAFSACPR